MIKLTNKILHQLFKVYFGSSSILTYFPYVEHFEITKCEFYNPVLLRFFRIFWDISISVWILGTVLKLKDKKKLQCCLGLHWLSAGYRVMTTSSNLGIKIFPFPYICYHSNPQWSVVSKCKYCTSFIKCFPKCLIHHDDMWNWMAFLLLFSGCSLIVCL